MTATFGLIFILAILAMLPLVFLGAGKDTNRARPSGIERQAEALMDWTDKDILAAERLQDAAVKRQRVRPAPAVPVETVKRDSFPQFAA